MENDQPQPPATQDFAQGKNWLRAKWKFALVAVVIVLCLVALLFHAGRIEATAPAALTTVAVSPVTREDLFNVVTIPAEFRPYVEVELHAKVSGYVDQMNVDFGDKVKAGQLLATLEVPELRDELRTAVAMEQKAEADYTNAHVLYTRLQDVNRQHPNLVAQQDLDNAQMRDVSATAAITGAKADEEKYQTLVDYTRITAPFDGVITHRYADPGALIQAGTTSDTQSLPLVRVSDNYRLRLDFPVSVAYVKDIQVGDSVEVRVDSMGGKKFTGSITPSMDKVNEETRTMTVEVEVANPNLEIIPGMYAAVELKVQHQPDALAIPLEAVSDEKSPTVYVINGNSEIESRPITLGLETPDKLQVASGLTQGELVMIGNRSFVHPGQKVDAKLIDPPGVP